MLHEEFFERTKVSLTGDEYAKVEAIYNSVQMDKDEFCQLWLKNRDNKIVAELMDTIKKLEDDCAALKGTNESLGEEVEGLKAQNEAERDNDALVHRQQMEGLAKKIVKAGEYDLPSEIYDVLEEEFGIQFIIKSKWEQGIELTEDEIGYMVGTLNK